MCNPRDVVVGQIDASQASEARKGFRWQLRNEVLLQATVKQLEYILHTADDILRDLATLTVRLYRPAV